jgi:DNA-binding response OmpR family regulator
VCRLRFAYRVQAPALLPPQLGPRASKQQILDHVWQYDFEGDGTVVETYVSYLRRKLDSNGPWLLQTVRGVGYALRLDNEDP